jgi:hypothetical protein
MFLGLLISYSASPDSLLYLDNAMIISGVASVWWLAGLADRTVRLKLFLKGLSSSSFFVFAAHEPLLTIIRKALYALLSPASGSAILALYFLIPIFVVTFLVVLHRHLLKTVPSVLSFITGSSYRPNKYLTEEPALT